MDSEFGKKMEKKEDDKMVEENNELMVQDEDQEEEILIPNWLIEVLEWIKRTEMADSALSTSSWAFNELCWPKLHGKNAKRHFVDLMRFYGNEDESGILHVSIPIDNRELQLPLPNVPPPEYILGFKCICIYYLDARILEFIERIAPKLNDVQFFFVDFVNDWGPKEEDKRTALVDCLLNMLASKIGQIHINIDTNFAKFNQLFPGFIDKLDSIFIYFLNLRMGNDFDDDVMYKWLTDREGNEGSKQKILELAHKSEEFLRNFFVRVKQEFTKATQSANFLINFPSGYGVVPEFGEFTLENEETGEVLISYQQQINGDVWLLLRCPKGEEERWKEEGEKKLMENRYKDGVKDIYVEISWDEI